MDKEITVLKALDYIKEIFSNDCSGHDYFHSIRVYQNALQIARDEECDLFVVALAAFLHDVDDKKLFNTLTIKMPVIF